MAAKFEYTNERFRDISAARQTTRPCLRPSIFVVRLIWHSVHVYLVHVISVNEVQYFSLQTSLVPMSFVETPRSPTFSEGY